MLEQLTQRLQNIFRSIPPQCCRTPLARPQRDWFAILFSLAGSIVLLALFGAWMYFAAPPEVPAAATGGARGPSVEELNALLSRYADMSVEHQNLLSAPAAVPDPSQ